jgi:hypothetical protein
MSQERKDNELSTPEWVRFFLRASQGDKGNLPQVTVELEFYQYVHPRQKISLDGPYGKDFTLWTREMLTLDNEQEADG